MKIGIDIRSMAGEKTGIGRYTENLIQGLASCDEVNAYLLYCFFFKSFRKKVAGISLPDGKRFSFVAKNIPGVVLRYLWNAEIFKIDKLIGNVDILLLPELEIPPVNHEKIVSVIHDVIPLISEKWHTRESARSIGKFIKRAVNRADMVITVSNHTKQDLIQMTGIKEEKVRVTYEGICPFYRKMVSRDCNGLLKRKYGIEDRFILFTGTIEPRKNLAALFKAYSLLKNERKVPHKLIVVGKKGWMYKDIFETVNRLGISEDVLFTGYVPDEELVLLYNAADLFVYPSFYEGFGLPPLEAMACGTPVITSNTSSLPEVVGDAGIMVDPHDVNGLASAMERVLYDEALRERMTADGLERAKLFSQENMARATLKVLEDVYKR
ncbi:MAG: glycosyltransferase family 4 protein [Candidatus Omnitrophica bacterium]|nr:glycosyltransferase family 4 protein [Candidatus Omnitrophota bacterium]